MKCASIKSLALCLLLAACSGGNAPIVGEWKVESLGADTRVFADGNASVAFSDEGRVSAYAGCNRIGGAYTVSGDVVEVSRMMSTRMACMPQQKMLDEQALVEALEGPRTVRFTGNKAILSKADGVVLVLWRARAQ